MTSVLLIINHNFVTLPNADSIISSKKQEINSTLNQATIDQFLLSNIVLNKVELKENYYDSIYYLDSENFNTNLPNHPSIKNSLKQSTASVPLTKKSTKVGSKLSSLRFKRLNKKESSPVPNLPDISSESIDEKLKYFSDDSESSDDDDLINEDELLKHEPLNVNSIICLREGAGSGVKRRKVCKDCTCGLAEKEAFGFSEVEVKPKVQFSLKELTEIDFTIEGKTGGCGSCSLGDAFRCSGCPFLGLPAFKPGQAITLDGIEDDL